jgi:hypothetical protein
MASHPDCGTPYPSAEDWRTESPRDRDGDSVSSQQDGSGEADVARVISEWVAACFPQFSPSSERDLRDLVHKAAEAAKNDFGASSAVAWAEGYRFPPEYVAVGRGASQTRIMTSCR